MVVGKSLSTSIRLRQIGIDAMSAFTSGVRHPGAVAIGIGVAHQTQVAVDRFQRLPLGQGLYAGQGGTHSSAPNLGAPGRVKGLKR